MRLYFPRAELVKFIWQSTEFLISYKVQLCFHILVLSPFTNIYIPIIFLVHMLRNKCLELISWMRIFIQPMHCCKVKIWYQILIGNLSYTFPLSQYYVFLFCFYFLPFCQTLLYFCMRWASASKLFFAAIYFEILNVIK